MFSCQYHLDKYLNDIDKPIRKMYNENRRIEDVKNDICKILIENGVASMNEQKIERTASYFSDQINRCQTQAQALTLDDRMDEAVFAKIEMNVYKIFSTVFSAAISATGQDEQALVQFFLTRIHQIPLSWHAAMEKAQLHEETEKVHIERIKLAAVEQIEREFEKIWEGQV